MVKLTIASIALLAAASFILFPMAAAGCDSQANASCTMISGGFTSSGVTSMTSTTQTSIRSVSSLAQPEMSYSVNVGGNPALNQPYALGTFNTGFSVSTLSGNSSVSKKVSFTDSMFVNGKARFSKSYSYKG